MKQGLEKFLAKKWMIFLLFASLTYVFGTKTDRRYGWTNEESRDATPIVSDGAGYYAFLPNWFIYEGTDFEFIKEINEKYPKTGFKDNFSTLKNGKLYYKYYTGTAQCLTPFFLIGHAHAQMAGEDADGYSWPYQLWLNVGMLFYVMLGFGFLFLLLRRLKLDYFPIYLTIIGLGMATNLCFYVYRDIPYAHVFSFAVVNGALLFWLKWIQEKRGRSFLIFAFLFGLSGMIRPTNGLILFILPFFFENHLAFVAAIKGVFNRKFLKTLVFAALVFSLPILVQLLTSYGQTGKLLLNAYSNEGFDNWKDPYMFQILFGFRKGMFIYAPFLLLMIPGLIVMFLKSQRRMVYGILLFTLISAYVISAWWCWWYGGALGMRSMIDFYGIFAIPIAFLIQRASAFWSIFLVVFSAFSIHVYQVYERQYNFNIMHYDYMNYPVWKKIFLKEDKRLNWVFYSKIDTLPEHIRAITPPLGFSLNRNPLSSAVIYGSKTHPVSMDNLPEMGRRFSRKDDLSFVGVQVSMHVFLNTPDENPTLLTQYFKGDSLLGERGTMIGWRPQNVGEWEKIKVDFVPEYRWKEIDSISCRLITGKNVIRFRELKIQFFEYDPLE
ncbi:hypothetical protein [Fluviicola chungangensis]|uniref:Glycosyltransferase RgtA/B/C/D-like domain-containing protein n=1 Tax=Fluviicola chungangensis TaxID=2597671 RepID=A0A556N7P0_9FLAO|nr:hypothetical protein [Fluviicola chungangensis]TSJ48175.1 hypothetical protein FO442_03290 [Fluviicola chungangensis]